MPAQPNQSLIDGIVCLQSVVAADGPVGSRELARSLGEEHTRISRLLTTLASIGLLERTPSRKYRPGPGVHVLAAQSLQGSHLLAGAMPHLKPLLGRGMTVGLGVLWRRQVCFLFHSRPGQPLEESIGRHQLHPADRSSAGLALLAHALPTAGPPPSRRRWAAEPAVPVTDLDAALEGVRRLGYARLRVPEKGLLSLGRTIGDPPVAALAISGPWSTAEVESQLALLRESVARIERDLAALQGP